MKIVTQYVSMIYLSYCGSFRALGIVECMVGYFKNKTKQMEQLCLDVACHKFDVLSGSFLQSPAKHRLKKRLMELAEIG